MSNRDEKSVTVPKFASFKSKSKAEAAGTTSGSTSSQAVNNDSRGETTKRHDEKWRDEKHRDERLHDERRHDGKRRGERRHDERRHEERRHDERRHEETRRGEKRRRRGDESQDDEPGGHHRRPRSRGDDPRQTTKERGKDLKSGEDSLFVLDHHGDPLIRRYGSNDRSCVPAYRRGGFGRIIGSDGFLEIHHNGTKDEFTIRGHREGGSAFRDQSFIRVHGQPVQARRVRPSRPSPAAQDPLAEAQDFLPLDPSRKRKRENLSTPPHQSHGMSGHRADGDSDLDSESSSPSPDSSDGERDISSVRRNELDLRRRVREHPEDTDAWLELIDRQDDIFAEVGQDRNTRTADEVRGIAKQKLSILDSALRGASSSADRERLELAYMREIRVTAPPASQAKRWASLVQANPTSFALQKGYLAYEMTSGTTYSYETVQALLVARLRSLEERIDQATTEEAIRLCEEWIYMFLWMTRSSQDAGYSELAVAAWQALLELTFARPKTPVMTSMSAKESLGEFWESEIHRIGEDGAQGWRRFAESTQKPDPPEGKERSVVLQSEEAGDVFKEWAFMEHSLCREAKVPARTMDDGVDLDPWRRVTFDQIEPLLAVFPADLIPNIEVVLFDAFLVFCGLPPGDGESEIIKSAVDDPFIYKGSEAFGEELRTQADSSSSEQDNWSKEPPRFVRDGSHLAISLDVLFAGRTWFNFLAANFELRRDDVIIHNLALLTLRQLTQQFGVQRLAEYSLAMEWLRNPSTIRKSAKALLKLYPARYTLYNAYALAEWAAGHVNMAQTILSSATAQFVQSPGAEVTRALWNTWAWIELENENLQVALSRLCSSVASDGQAATEAATEASPSLILKAKSNFASTRDYMLSSERSEGLRDATVHAQSLALVEYLATDSGTEPRSEKQGNISAALASIASFSNEVVSRGKQQSPELERLLQFAARLLYFHSTHGSFRPTYLQEQLYNFINLFPKNTMFLTMFAWADSSFSFNDPVRQILSDVVLAKRHDCLSSRIFAIQYELRRGTVHSTRAAFEKALAAEACRNNPPLWVSYVRFCSQRREYRPKAREVFFRGVASCPWSKALLLEAFTTLRWAMSESDLRDVYGDMSLKKEMRIHEDLEALEMVRKKAKKARSEMKY